MVRFLSLRSTAADALIAIGFDVAVMAITMEIPMQIFIQTPGIIIMVLQDFQLVIFDGIPNSLLVQVEIQVHTISF